MVHFDSIPLHSAFSMERPGLVQIFYTAMFPKARSPKSALEAITRIGNDNTHGSQSDEPTAVLATCLATLLTHAHISTPIL